LIPKINHKINQINFKSQQLELEDEFEDELERDPFKFQLAWLHECWKHPMVNNQPQVQSGAGSGCVFIIEEQSGWDPVARSLEDSGCNHGNMSIDLQGRIFQADHDTGGYSRGRLFHGRLQPR